MAVGARIELRREGHSDILRENLKELSQNEAYWNVMVFCSNGTLALNRLSLGLIFPQLRDEVSVICPDHSVEEITSLVDNMLDREDSMVWPATVCQVDWGIVEPRVAATISTVAEGCDDLVEVDEVRDPLDQLCFDLAPFTLAKTDDGPEIEFIGTSEKRVETVDLTDNVPYSPIRRVKEELQDPLADILAESSDDEEDVYNNDENMMDSLYHNSDLYYTENERMAQEILDSVIDNLEEHKRRYKEKAFQSAQVLFYSEAVEYIEEKPDIGELEDSDMETLSTWDIGLDKGGKCKKENRVDLKNMRLDYDAWSQINKIMREREAKNKENNGLKNKRIYLEKKKSHVGEAEENDSNRCHDCSIVLSSRRALQEHNQTIHDTMTFKARPTRYKIVDQAIEITPMREARSKRLANSGSSSSRTNGIQSMAKKSTTKPPRRCGSCKACTAPDCRKCVYCLDMKKYGGPGTKKQRCLKRPNCLGLQSVNSPTSDIKTSKALSSTNSSRNGRAFTASSDKQNKESSPTVIKRAPAKPQELLQNSSSIQARSPLSAARKHLREVENESKPRLQTRSSSPRVKDDLKERLRKKREGEWDRTSRIGKAARSLSSRYKKEAEQRRTVSTRKLPLPSRTWPSKEELLFGFPLCDN